MARILPLLKRPYVGQELMHNFDLGLWRVFAVSGRQMELVKVDDYSTTIQPLSFNREMRCESLTDRGEIPVSWQPARIL